MGVSTRIHAKRKRLPTIRPRMVHGESEAPKSLSARGGVFFDHSVKAKKPRLSGEAYEKVQFQTPV